MQRPKQRDLVRWEQLPVGVPEIEGLGESLRIGGALWLLVEIDPVPALGRVVEDGEMPVRVAGDDADLDAVQHRIGEVLLGGEFVVRLAQGDFGGDPGADVHHRAEHARHPTGIVPDDTDPDDDRHHGAVPMAVLPLGEIAGADVKARQVTVLPRALRRVGEQHAGRLPDQLRRGVAEQPTELLVDLEHGAVRQ